MGAFAEKLVINRSKSGIHPFDQAKPPVQIRSAVGIASVKLSVGIRLFELLAEVRDRHRETHDFRSERGARQTAAETETARRGGNGKRLDESRPGV